MISRTLAHLSDLHVGRNDETDGVLERMCRVLMKRNVDHVVVTGDITHRGRRSEWARFEEAFAPLAERNRLTVVPGNHDRLNDDIGADIMPEGRVLVEHHPGLHLVRFDSTGPHNRTLRASHGEMSEVDVANILEAFENVPEGSLAVLLLHHHLIPLPHDNHAERIFSWLGLASAEELSGGATLLSALRGRCDLVLHGHRHDPLAMSVWTDESRPLSLFNAGSSTELAHVRMFIHRDGRLTALPMWLPILPSRPAPFFEYVGATQIAGQESLIP